MRQAGRELAARRETFESTCAWCGIRIIGLRRRRFCTPAHQRKSYHARCRAAGPDGELPSIEAFHHPDEPRPVGPHAADPDASSEWSEPA